MASDSRDEVFRTLLEPHRRTIMAHCYRVLGSLQDAEELTQKSLLRAWQRLDELRASAASKAWLYRIATNACLDQTKQRRARRVTGRDDAQIAERYIAIWESGDIPGFTALLANDAIMSMPPQVEWFAGPDAIRRFFEGTRERTEWQYRFVQVRADGAAGVAVYTRPPTGGPYRAAGIATR